MSLSLPNVKVAAGHRTLPQIKVTGLNIFRDFLLQNNQKYKLIVTILRGNSPKFLFQYTNCHACEFDLDCQGQGNRQMILIPEIIRMISVYMHCTISIFKADEKETYSPNQYNVYSRRCSF